MQDFSYARELSKGKRSSLLYLERKQNPWSSSPCKQLLPYFTISISNRHYWRVYKGALITFLTCILAISHTQKDLVFLKLSVYFFQAVPTVRTVFQWALQLTYYLSEIYAVQFANLMKLHENKLCWLTSSPADWLQNSPVVQGVRCDCHVAGVYLGQWHLPEPSI